jgi:hypothetical protein
MKEHFGISLRYDELRRGLAVDVLVFWALGALCFVAFVVNTRQFGWFDVIYIVLIELPCHLMHMQAFHIYIFTRAIERRLHLISSLDSVLPRCAADVKKCLQSIFAVWREFYGCMEPHC